MPTSGSSKGQDSAPNLSRQEHQPAADAKRVTIVGHDGANYYLAGVNSSGELLVSGAAGGSGLATVTVLQGTDPWIINGTVGFAGTVTTTETVTCLQGTDPWIVDATFGAVTQGTSPWIVNGTVGVVGDVNVTQGTSPWVVDGTVTVIGGGSETVTCLQGTSPWVVNGTVGVTGDVNVTQGTSPWVVNGTVGVVGDVNVTQGTDPWLVGGTVTAVGNVAHGSPDSQPPVKVGGRADISYDDGTYSHPGAQVDDDDRADRIVNSYGEPTPAVYGQLFDLSPLDSEYNDNTTTASVSTMFVWPYREFELQFSIDASFTATDIRYEVFTSIDGTAYGKHMNDGMANLVYSATTIGGGINRSVYFKARTRYMRVSVTAVGTDVTNTFTTHNSALAAST